MLVTVEIPDELISALVPEGMAASRALLEEAVAGAYRAGRLTTTGQVRRLLGLRTRMQATTFLLQHKIYDYTIEDLESDFATLQRLFPANAEMSRK